MILSFHPCIEVGIHSFIHAQRFTEKQKKLIKQANAIILPLGIIPEIYLFCRYHCKNIFPNYDHRFPGEGKVGDAILWKRFNMPHPRTRIYGRAWLFEEEHIEKKRPLPFRYPFVVKANQGGEGNMVFLIPNETILIRTIEILKRTEEHVKYPGLVLQEFVDTKGKNLMVVVVNRRRFFFWRVQKDPDQWKTNVSRGAEISFDVSPETKRVVGSYLEPFLGKTGINLAAIDILIARGKPLFLEINYYFGRRAFGNSDNFYGILREEIEHWLKDAQNTNSNREY